MNGCFAKTCPFDRMVRRPNLLAAAKAGTKIRQRRDGYYAWPGEEFESDGAAFAVADLKRFRVGGMNNGQARAEGYFALECYQALMLQMHPDTVGNHDARVGRHTFAVEQGG